MKLITHPPKKVSEIDHVKTGALCRKEREALGIFQTDMAKQMGCDKSQLCELESGIRHWSQSWVDKANSAMLYLKQNPVPAKKVGRPRKQTQIQ